MIVTHATMIELNSPSEHGVKSVSLDNPSLAQPCLFQLLAPFSNIASNYSKRRNQHCSRHQAFSSMAHEALMHARTMELSAYLQTILCLDSRT